MPFSESGPLTREQYEARRRGETPETTQERIQQNRESARIQAEAIPRTPEQRRAFEQGVPVEAFRDPRLENRRQFQARIATGQQGAQQQEGEFRGQVTAQEANAARSEAQRLLQENVAGRERPTEENQLIEGTLEEVLQAKEDTSLLGGLRDFLTLDQQELTDKLIAEGREPTAFLVANVNARNRVGTAIVDALDTALLIPQALGGIVPFVDQFFPRQQRISQEISALEPKKQEAASVAKLVQEGTLSPEDGFRALNTLERRTNEAEERIRRDIILSPGARLEADDVDAQADILELRQEIFDARAVVASTVVVEPVPELLALRMRQLGLEPVGVQ